MMFATSYWDEPGQWLSEALDNVQKFFEDDPVRRLQSAAQDAVSSVEQWLSSFSVGDWVLVGIAAIAVYWVVASLRALTRLGPVEVDVLEHDGEKKAPTAALTAALRERLNSTGLSPPPAVPAGTPKVDLISAVEASNIPQSAWLAKLLQLLPTPPKPSEYRITGVLLGVEVEPEPVRRRAGVTATPTPCGISYWIRPSHSGSASLAHVDKCGTHADAVRKAASRIYLHISNDAVDAFPLWARWRDTDALEAYLSGCRMREEPGGDAAAVGEFRAAIGAEVHNALGPLQLANLYERAAADAVGYERARALSDVLRRYLTIAAQWPELVEARYRASVVASGLAASLDEPMTRLEQIRLLRRMGDNVPMDLPIWAVVPRMTTVQGKLRGLAARESKAVLQLLRPYYALFREMRLRNQFEPKAQERRRLRHTVNISKHSVRLRKLRGHYAPWHRGEILYRLFVVHVVHLWLGRGGIGWQGHYNAACFNALLFERLRS
jgi:hypothetical protein